jgi:molecular chaperone DnaK (HSP70)
LDATIVNISHKSATFSVYKVLSNVGDISLGLEDIDERLANFVLTEKIKFDEKLPRSSEPIKLDILTVVCLIDALKEHIYRSGSAILNLSSLNLRENTEAEFDETCEIFIDKDVIKNFVCKDIYEWSLIHVRRALKEASLEAKQIDQVLFLANQVNLPGFLDSFKDAYPSVQVKFIGEDELGLGALKTVGIWSLFDAKNKPAMFQLILFPTLT